ncbi:MAG: hypothetical protein WC878_01780 [Candidatus Paceibacterota bacterium]|jgi:hypothetical protein
MTLKNLPTAEWMKRIHYSWENIISGIFIYAIGDSIAQCITGSFSISRMFGIALIGCTLYAIEIPNWFIFIDRITKNRVQDWKTKTYRMLLAIAYFNPLWIARHIALVLLISGKMSEISWALIGVGFSSFLYQIPITIFGNFIIQNKLEYKWRFLANCVFSGLMAVYFALSAVWFK